MRTQARQFAMADHAADKQRSAQRRDQLFDLDIALIEADLARRKGKGYLPPHQWHSDTSTAAAEAIARGWRKARAGDSLSLLPMSDGGDGFGEVTSALLKARSLRVRTVDAAHRPCVAKWWWEPRTRTAVIESAAVIVSLTLLGQIMELRARGERI